MQSEKIQDVSARVELTPMPKQGVDQFNFKKRSGELSANQVEALLQFNDHVPVKDLFGCLNKLLGAYLTNGETDFSTEDAIVLEHTYQFILNSWRAETDSFEQNHPEFLAG